MEHVNAQSLLGNFNEIEFMIYERHIDILCISESWLLPVIQNSCIQMSGYSIYRSDAGRGGGVCVYVRENLKVTVITPVLERPPLVEDLWLSVQLHKFPSFIVGCVYRHPHAHIDSFDYISGVFTSMSLRNKPLLIVGDFNDDLLKPCNKISKITQTLHLDQLVSKPTRISAASSTLIDLIITNRTNFVIQSDVLSSPIADHELLTATINLRKDKYTPNFKTFRCHENYSQNNFCELLLNESQFLNTILNTDDVNEQVHIFNNTFIKCLDVCAPFKTKEMKRPPAPWIDSEIREAMKVREDLHKKFKANKHDPAIHNNYKREKKRIRQMLSEKKKSYYRNEFSKCKGDIRGTWSVVKKLIPDTKKSNTLCNDQDIDVQKKAEEFNKYFSNIGRNTFERSQVNVPNVNLSHNDQPPPSSRIRDKFRPQPTDMDTLIITIKDLKPTNSSGSDGIQYRFLMDSLPTTISYILILVNTSIVTGNYPDPWRHPYVVPVHKSGDTENVENYRPISLVSILSKIIEKIVVNQLTSFLETNHLLSKEQHGFRQNLSTETALLKITNKIYENMDSKKISLLLLLDLSKAFDSVHHPTLMKKLAKVNVDSFWFESYLSGRIQSVRFGSALSSPLDISFGVPQGSILGPLLFLIYINDLPEHIRDCLLVMYADDTQILLTDDINNIEDLIKRAESILTSTKNYFNLNGLLLNENKTQLIFFGSRQYISRLPDNLNIKFNNVTLIPTQSVKNLGVIMDSYMTFNLHIDELQKKVIGTLLYLNRVYDRFDPECRIMVVQALVVSVLNYCLRVWGSTNVTQLERVGKLHNFAAKVAVGGARKHDHVTPIFKKLKWLRMDTKYFYDICVFVFKITHKLLPEWLFPMPIVGQLRIGTMNTRHQNSLFVPRTITDMGARNLKVVGPTFWNSLPTEIKNCHTLPLFKSRLLNYLLENP